MNKVETLEEKTPHRFWADALICRLFHPIETLQNCSFIDPFTGKSVGKYCCKKCNLEYLANNKRDMFRCYL
jgi:hypothetical protein